jgi:hypothetical protein
MKVSVAIWRGRKLSGRRKRPNIKAGENFTDVGSAGNWKQKKAGRCGSAKI